MKLKISHIIFLLFASVWMTAQAESAQKILDKCAEKIRTSPSIKASYNITAQGSGTTSGSLTLCGDKFIMSSPNLKVWYDGKTQWSYMVVQEEVNVTEPTADELQQINPLIILQKFKNTYTPSVVKSTTAGTNKIKLTSKTKNADIRSAIVTINSSTHLPSAISITMASGQVLNITLTGISVGKSIGISAFRFPTKTYPKAEIIDLR